MRRANEAEVERRRLELVLSSSRLGLWDWNMQTGEATYDERWAQIAGYHLRELEPLSFETWEGLANADDLAASNAMIVEHIQGLIPFYEITVRVRHKAGHWVWVRSRGKIVQWTPDGRPARMMGTHADITDEVERTEALARSERRFTAMFHLHDAVMLLIDVSTGAIVEANEAASAYYGYPLDTLRSMSMREINAAAGVEGRTFGARVASREQAHFTAVHRLASGETRRVDVHASPVLDDDRTLAFAIVTDLASLDRSPPDSPDQLNPTS